MLNHGLSLAQGLGGAKAIYGKTFDPSSSLRALCSFADGDLKDLPAALKDRLLQHAKAVYEIPEVEEDSYPYDPSSLLNKQRALGNQCWR